jgi:hypothetical protein
MRLACAAMGLALIAGGCTSAVSDDAPSSSTGVTSSSAAATPSVSAPAAVRTPVDGIWRLRQTKDDIRRHLQQHGYGDRVEEFIRVEQVWDVDQWEWSFDDGTFTARWLTPDGVWKVADYGTFSADADTVIVTFAEGDPGSSTTFGYTIDGDTLRLDWQSHAGSEEVKGFPDEAFWRAYLTAPLTRVS